MTDFDKIKNNKEIILLDVRTEGEFNFVNIGGVHIPLDVLDKNLSKLDLAKTIYCLCHHGVRSRNAALFLDANGAQDTVNIEGGIDAYSMFVDSSIVQY